MKALTTFIAIALLAFSTTACSQQHTYRSGGFGSKTVKASKNYVTKDIKVDNFTKLSVAGSPDVTYTQKSGKPTVEVYTSDNIVDLLDIRVKDNTLYIGFKKNVSVSYNKLEVRVSAEKLNGIAVAGSGDVELKNGLKTDDIKISVAGSGDISGNNISCTDLDISIAGSGDINSSNITCNDLQVSVAGSGDMKLNNVTDTWRSLQVMSLLLMSPEPAMEISRSMQEMLFPLMSPEPATEILRLSVFSPFFSSTSPEPASAMPFSFSADTRTSSLL